MQTIVNLVSAGIGVAWVPASVMGFQRADVVYQPVVGAPVCETRLHRCSDATPAVRRFVDHVESQRVQSECQG